MKVRLTTGLAGPFRAYSPGDEYPCDVEEAKRLIAAGFAIETTAVDPIAETRAPAKRKAKG